MLFTDRNTRPKTIPRNTPAVQTDFFASAVSFCSRANMFACGQNCNISGAQAAFSLDSGRQYNYNKPLDFAPLATGGNPGKRCFIRLWRLSENYSPVLRRKILRYAEDSRAFVPLLGYEPVKICQTTAPAGFHQRFLWNCHGINCAFPAWDFPSWERRERDAGFGPAADDTRRAFAQGGTEQFWPAGMLRLLLAVPFTIMKKFAAGSGQGRNGNHGNGKQI